MMITEKPTKTNHHHQHDHNRDIENPKLCIPRIHSTITKEQITQVISDLDIGIIEKIDVIKKKNATDDFCNMCFISFSKWNDNQVANQAYKRIISGKDIKIIYDEPWFWKISAVRS